jgi:hypothetical protein
MVDVRVAILVNVGIKVEEGRWIGTLVSVDVLLTGVEGLHAAISAVIHKAINHLYFFISPPVDNAFHSGH